MTPDELAKCGQSIYGRGWRAPLARALDISARQMHRYANGEWPIKAHIAYAVKYLVLQTQKRAE